MHTYGKLENNSMQVQFFANKPTKTKFKLNSAEQNAALPIIIKVKSKLIRFQ